MYVFHFHHETIADRLVGGFGFFDVGAQQTATKTRRRTHQVGTCLCPANLHKLIVQERRYQCRNTSRQKSETMHVYECIVGIWNPLGDHLSSCCTQTSHLTPHRNKRELARDEPSIRGPRASDSKR